MLLGIEIAFILAGLVGVALWSVPAALIAGAVLGVLAIERASADRKRAAQIERDKGAPR